MTYNEYLEQQEYEDYCKKLELINKIRTCANTIENYINNPSNALLLDDALDAAETLSEVSDTFYKEIETNYSEWKQQEEQNEIKASYY